MNATIFIKPATEGAVVRMPERAMRPLAATGEAVDNSFFWQRRLLHGDVVKADAEAAATPALEAAPPAAPIAPAADESDADLRLETTLTRTL
jgi:hypothetical protein